MFNLNPYYSGYPSYGSYAPSDAEYRRALAEERAAREQYAAARRAQEEARQRAARARAARRAYASPYNSYLMDDHADLDYETLDDGAYQPPRPFGYASSPYGFGPSADVLEEQRRRELLALQQERERRQLEEARIRRIIEEERRREEAERQKTLEEERLRRALEDERLKKAMAQEEEARRERERAQWRPSSQQNGLEPLLRALGFVPANDKTSGEDTREGRPTTRATTLPPNVRRAGAVPPSPIRHQASRKRTPSPPVQRAPSTSRPISIRISSPEPPSPKVPSPKPTTPTPPTIPVAPVLADPTPEQTAAAEKIRDAYRKRLARRTALKSISVLRKRFLALRTSLTLPTTLDYAPTADPHEHITVSADPALFASAPPADVASTPTPTPKLAYTPNNAPVHALEEELNRLLNDLDGVQSAGDLGVRAARKELVRVVEGEAERVERWRIATWRRWVDKQRQFFSAFSVPVSEASSPVAEKPVVVEEVSASQQPVPMDAEPVAEESSPQEVDAEAAVIDADHLSEDSVSTIVPDEPTPMDAEPTEVPITGATDTMEVDPPASDAVPAPSTATQPAVPETSEINVKDEIVPETAEPPPVNVPVAAVEAETSPTSEQLSPLPLPTPAEAPTSPVEEPRSTTPALSHDDDMDVEPHEAHTPPLAAAALPAIVVSEEPVSPSPIQAPQGAEQQKTTNDDDALAHTGETWTVVA